MSTRMLTGLLLIIGPIVLLAGFITFAGSGVVNDWSDTAGTVAELGKNSGLVKTALSIVVLGMLGGAAGLAGLNHSMAGGSGAHYARLGLLLYVIGITIGIAEYTLLIGIAGAAGDGQAGAETLFTASQAIGAGATTIWFLGLAVIGISIFVQKNLHSILAALIVIVGVIGTVFGIIDYSSDLLIIPMLGSIVVTIATGALFLRSES
jgi:hypothetical protein